MESDELREHCANAQRFLEEEDFNAFAQEMDILGKAGHHFEISQILRGMLNKYPQLASLHYNLATSLHFQGKNDEAEKTLMEALRLEPDFSGAHFLLGHVKLGLKKINEAIAAWERAMELDPSFSTIAHYNIGKAYMKIRQYEKAADALRKAVSIEPDDADAQENFGLALGELGDHTQAAMAFRKAVELRRDPRNLWNLGVSLKKLGMIEEAGKYFVEALKLIKAGHPLDIASQEEYES